MRFIKEHIVFTGVFLLCLLLRAFPLFDYQFTFDELSGLDRTQFDSFSEVMDKGVKIDAHPALIQLMLYYTVKLAGYSEWLIKLPFLLFGFGAVIFAYRIGDRHFSRQAALMNALFFSFSLVFVFYAPIARMYISGVFFSLALLYYFFEIFFAGRVLARNFFWLGFFALLSALNQHINALFAFTVFLAALFFLTPQNRKSFYITAVLTVLCYLPHLPVTLYQLGVGGIGTDQGGWLEKPDLNALWKLIRVLLGSGYNYLFVFVLILLSLVFQKNRIINRKQMLLLILFIFNFLIVYLYSLLRASVYQHSVMLFAGSAFIVLIGSLLQFEKQKLFYAAFVILSGTLIFTTYFSKDYLNQAVKTVYEEQFVCTIDLKQKYGDEKVEALFFDADTLMKKIYFDKYGQKFDCRISDDSIISYSSRVNFGSDNNPVTSFRLFSDFIKNTQAEYILLASASPRYHALVADRFPYLIKNIQTFAVNIKIFSRRAADQNKTVEDEKILVYSNPATPGDFVYNVSGKSMTVDSTNEFPFSARAAYNDVINNEGEIVLSRAVVRYKHSKPRELESCVVVEPENGGQALSYNAKAAADYAGGSDSSVIIYSDAYIGYHHRIKGNHRLQCYLWNKGKENVVLENFEIRVIDYWHNKWHFWD